MKSILVFFIFHISIFSVQAQYLTGMSTSWSDSFVEWEIFTDDEELNGELKMRWQMQEDWSQWDYRLDDAIGSIKQKWKDNPNEWEVRGDNKVITARTIYRDDFREWRITDNSKTLRLKTRFGNNGNEWILEGKDYGFMEIYTEWENDPRDWIIVDELSDDVPLPMKMAVVFLAIYQSSPRQ